MKYVLIMWLVSTNGLAIDNVEYDSYLACKQAQSLISNLSDMRSLCTRKGDASDDME